MRYGVLVHIFYGHNVVGGNTYSIYTKMGVGKRPDYVLGNVQSEYAFIIGMGFRVDIFYTQRCW